MMKRNKKERLQDLQLLALKQEERLNEIEARLDAIEDANELYEAKAKRINSLIFEGRA